VPDHFLGFDLTENRRARPCSDRAVPSAARARLARPVVESPHEHTVVATNEALNCPVLLARLRPPVLDQHQRNVGEFVLPP
jgi:hypothetical protein